MHLRLGMYSTKLLFRDGAFTPECWFQSINFCSPMQLFGRHLAKLKVFCLWFHEMEKGGFPLWYDLAPTAVMWRAGLPGLLREREPRHLACRRKGKKSGFWPLSLCANWWSEWKGTQTQNSSSVLFSAVTLQHQSKHVGERAVRGQSRHTIRLTPQKHKVATAVKESFP